MLRPWRVGIFVFSALIALPVFTILGFIFYPAGDVWTHLVETVLADYVSNSLILMVEVAIGAFTLGVSTAWLTSMCRFPGRRFFEWALLLPMAVPAYIIAYTYTGMFDFAGPVQTTIRETFGWGYGEYWFPEIRSLGGAGLMFSLVLYPYVYLLARASFLSQSICVLDVSRTLGNGPWRTFFTVSLPLARPAIFAGVSLALMETLADFGTVQYFGISTFTTGIYRTWYGLDNSVAAAQLSALLLFFVFALLIFEQYSRRNSRYHDTGQRHQPLPNFMLTRLQQGLSFSLCMSIFALGFLLPGIQLFVWALATTHMLDKEFFSLAMNSLLLAMVAAFVALVFALLLAYGKRLCPTKATTTAVRISGMGYAVPGTVIAVGVMIPFSWLDNQFDALMREYFSISTGLLLSGTIFALIYAYVVRFFAVSLQAVESGLGKIKHSMDEAASLLGYRYTEILRYIHMPVLRGSLFTALLLVFVDVLKELPATLILRPFNFNTLAVRAFELASDERLADSSSAALAIVLVGIIPVILLSRAITRTRQIQ